MTSTTTSIALPWVVLVSTMSFCSLVGNIVVVIVIIRDRLLKGPNYTLALVCNMAISDTLYVGVAIPLILAGAFTKENWILGNAGCKLMMFLPNFCIASSIYTMVIIAFDRRVTILTNQRRIRRNSSIYLALLLVWLLSAAVAAPAFYEYSVYQRSSFFLSDGYYAGSSSEEVDDDVAANNMDFYLACGSHDIVESFERIYAAILFVVAYILPLFIISINYVIIVRFFMKRRSVAPIPQAASSAMDKEKPHRGDNIPFQLSNRPNSLFSPGQDVSTSQFHGAWVHQQENYSKATYAGMKNDQGPEGPAQVSDKPKTFVQKVTTRVTKMLLILVVMFAISWAPYFILFVREEVTGADDTARFGEVFHVVKLIASLLTSLLNPLVYAAFDSRIRKGIARLGCWDS